MLVLKKFLCCMSLRLGGILIGYLLTMQGFINVFLVVVEFGNFCQRLVMIWILQSQLNIIAGILLLASASNPVGLAYLCPIQIVVKLTSLIVELIFYLLMASSSFENDLLVAYSFLSIICTVYIVLVVFSFYQESEGVLQVPSTPRARH